MGKRYELVCDESRIFCVIGYGGICGMNMLVDHGNESREAIEFLNRTKGQSLRMMMTEWDGGGYQLGYDEITDVLEAEAEQKERKVDE